MAMTPAPSRRRTGSSVWMTRCRARARRSSLASASAWSRIVVSGPVRYGAVRGDLLQGRTRDGFVVCAPVGDRHDAGVDRLHSVEEAGDLGVTAGLKRGRAGVICVCQVGDGGLGQHVE